MSGVPIPPTTPGKKKQNKNTHTQKKKKKKKKKQKKKKSPPHPPPPPPPTPHTHKQKQRRRRSRRRKVLKVKKKFRITPDNQYERQPHTKNYHSPSPPHPHALSYLSPSAIPRASSRQNLCSQLGFVSESANVSENVGVKKKPFKTKPHPDYLLRFPYLRPTVAGPWLNRHRYLISLVVRQRGRGKRRGGGGGGGWAEDGERLGGGWQRASHVGLLNHRPAEGRKGGWVGKKGWGEKRRGGDTKGIARL